MVSIKDVEDARNRIGKFINDTPIVSSSLLNIWLGHEIFFKLECMQKIGAFKARGACNAISWLIEQGQKPKCIVANSSGNHAQAVAWAAGQFQIPSIIFMPNYSSSIKVQATRSYGAQVELCETRNEADEKVLLAAEEVDCHYIPPYNHEQIISGQGTAAYDALQAIDDIDAVFAPCGGGGLLSGTLIAARALSSKAQVFGAEPLNANDAAESLRKGSIQSLNAVPDTLADGAMTMAVGRLTFEYLKKLDGFYEIDESSIKYWAQWLSHLLKVQIEPTSALAMAAAAKWLKGQKSKKRLLVIISGGNVDKATLDKIWEKSFLDCLP